MTTMHFTSTLKDQVTKFVHFDSSPGRAISKRLGDGMWDERSYKSKLMETQGDEEIYEVYLRRNPPQDDPQREMPLEKVGFIRYKPALN